MSQIPSTHRALVVNADHSGWEVKEQAIPAYDDLLVKVHAVGLNPTDWKHCHFKQIKPGSSTGSDFAGVVVAAKGGAQWKVGDRVAGFTRGGFLQQDNGAFAEYTAAQTPIVWRIPEGTTFEEAAAIGGIPVDTAAQALYTRLDIPRPWDAARETAVKAGDAILIWSGASSVSHYAIQLAKLAGLKVYTTASKHHTHLPALGADAVFDHHASDEQETVGQKINKASEDSIKVALDGYSHAESIELVAQALSSQGGKIVSILGGWKADDFEAKHPNVEVISNVVYDVLEEKNAVDRVDIAEWHKVLPGLLASKKVRAHNIDHQLGGLEAIPEGLLRLKDGKVSGQRIVYTISK